MHGYRADLLLWYHLLFSQLNRRCLWPGWVWFQLLPLGWHHLLWSRNDCRHHETIHRRHSVCLLQQPDYRNSLSHSSLVCPKRSRHSKLVGHCNLSRNILLMSSQYDKYSRNHGDQRNQLYFLRATENRIRRHRHIWPERWPRRNG